MSDVVDAEMWRSIIDAVELPTHSEIARGLEDALGMSDQQAHNLVEAAVSDDDGPLVESDYDGAFTTYTVADATIGEDKRRTGTDLEPTTTEATAGSNTDTDENEAENEDDGDGDPSTAVPSGRVFYPDTFLDRPYWVNWVKAYPYDDDADKPGVIDYDAVPTKQPTAPYQDGEYTADPVRWNGRLSDDQYPATDYETVEPWAGTSIPDEIPADERVISDKVGAGIIIPTPERRDGYPGEDLDARPIVLLDWDDVRDPETGAIHPVVENALETLGGYAEISQSGTGIHQFAFGEIPAGRRKFIRHIADEPFVGDDRPQIEMYSSGRVCALTGRHVEGTGDDITEGQDVIDNLVWEFGTGSNNAEGRTSDPFAHKRDGETGDTNAATDPAPATNAALDSTPGHDEVGEQLIDAESFEGEDPDEWDIPDGRSLEYCAVLRARERSDELASTANWKLLGYIGAIGCELGLEKNEIYADLKAHPTPQYGFDKARAKKEIGGVYRRAQQGNNPLPSRSTLAERGILPDRYATNDPSNDRQFYDVETCEPAQRETTAFDQHKRWDELQNERLEAALEDDQRLHIWADEAGSGKTTNGPIGAADRDIPYFIAFQKHEKAREYITDEATPDGHFHLKGGEQPVHDCCMDAKTEADDGEYPECPTHGGPDEWPHMLPIYDEEKDDDERQAFEAIMSEVGVRKAIEVLELDGGEWEQQFDKLESKDRVVGVHEYLALRTARKGRVCFIDETPDLLADNPSVSVKGLTQAANTLNRCGELADDGGDDEDGESEAETFHELATFARSVVDLITGGPDTPNSLDALDAPRFESDPMTINRTVDPSDLPEDVDPDEVEERTYRETKDSISGQYTKHHRHAVERELPGERLAKLKVEYGETIVNRMRDDRWEGSPLCLDQVFAAAAEAGLDNEAAMKAIAVPSVLEYCPWCHSDLVSDNGARVCSADGCDWHEEYNTITHENGEQARASAWIETDRDDAPINLSGRILPLSSELPEPADTIVLDATATPEKVGALFKADAENQPAVSGDMAHDMPNIRTTQVMDGQYHAGTITSDGSDTLRDRIQRTIDTAATVHEHPLYLVKKGLIENDDVEFDFPENGEVLHYHAARGLNRSECDAVVCIGAPHPDVTDLQRDAELLAMGRDNVRAGGDEHSTRRGAPNPPVYRKLHYEDDDGKGRAVPTKAYTGMTGSLFRETREKELVQAVHRIRPLLIDDNEQKHAYLLTNVPTRLEVDELATFEELADPVEAMLPVPEGAVELLETVRDVAAGGGPDGFRADALIEQRDDGTIANKVAGYHQLAQLTGMDVSKSTVYNWIHALEDVGLVQPETYEQRRGVSYSSDESTLQSALLVLSSNGSFKVAAKRRLKALLAKSGGSLDWLGWAREMFGLRGDRERRRDDPGRGGSSPTPGS